MITFYRLHSILFCLCKRQVPRIYHTRVSTTDAELSNDSNFSKKRTISDHLQKYRGGDISILHNDTTLLCHNHFFAYHSVYQLIAMRLLFFDHFILRNDSYCFLPLKTELPIHQTSLFNNRIACND